MKTRSYVILIILIILSILGPVSLFLYPQNAHEFTQAKNIGNVLRGYSNELEKIQKDPSNSYFSSQNGFVLTPKGQERYDKRLLEINELRSVYYNSEDPLTNYFSNLDKRAKASFICSRFIAHCFYLISMILCGASWILYIICMIYVSKKKKEMRRRKQKQRNNPNY